MIYDVCVIGAGVNGSSAAYSLSKKNKNVLLLEQFPVPHTRGSSHGHSRIIRCLDEHKIYGLMTYNAFPIWKELEKKLGQKLLIQNGMLEIYDKSAVNKETRRLSTLNDLGVKYDVLTGEEVNTRFPLFSVPQTFSGIYEYEGGMLLASKCVAGLQKVFVKNGGTFKDSEIVTNILPGDIVTIQTSKGAYKAKSIIITAGSFTSKLTTSLGLNLPLRVERTHPLYWKLDDPTSGLAVNNFPSFIGPLGCYGLASLEYPGYIKICKYSDPPVDPDKPEADPIVPNVTEIIKHYMKGVAHTPGIVETCLYTRTPDHQFIIDVHPRYRNIVIGAGFSGSGFKMAPVTGNILADLALGINPSYDLSMFEIDRFDEDGLTSSKL